jgi:hypothetical protein
VTEPLIRRAADLAGRYRLRGYDSVHLAAAESAFGVFRNHVPFHFAVFDGELSDAAKQVGNPVALSVVLCRRPQGDNHSRTRENCGMMLNRQGEVWQNSQTVSFRFLQQKGPAYPASTRVPTDACPFFGCKRPVAEGLSNIHSRPVSRDCQQTAQLVPEILRRFAPQDDSPNGQRLPKKRY